MVYSNYLSAVIKVDGKVLRESEGIVALPFGSEYAITLHNINSVRALVRVSIDGQNISDASDGWFIIGDNDTLELERFLRNGNLNNGNKLKFIERMSQIENHRGIGGDDGLVRIEYKFEVVRQDAYKIKIYNTNGTTYISPPYTTWTTTCSDQPFGQPHISYSSNWVKDGLNGADRSSPFMKSSVSNSLNDKNMNSQVKCCSMQETSLNDAGITVAGSESKQEFTYGSWFPTEGTSHVIVLKLLGQVGNVAVKQPITVQQKPICSTCGKINKATFKFCTRCGTALLLL